MCRTGKQADKSEVVCLTGGVIYGKLMCRKQYYEENLRIFIAES